MTGPRQMSCRPCLLNPLRPSKTSAPHLQLRASRGSAVESSATVVITLAVAIGAKQPSTDLVIRLTDLFLPNPTFLGPTDGSGAIGGLHPGIALALL